MQYANNFESILNAGRMNDIRLIGMISLLFILGVILIGMNWMTRVQIVLLVSRGPLKFFIISTLKALKADSKKGLTVYTRV